MNRVGEVGATIKAAQGLWKDILPALGVDQKYLVNRHQDCPICGGTDRFRFDDKEGSGSYYCNGCRSGKGIDLVMRLNSWTFARAAREVDAVLGNPGFVATTPSRALEITPEQKRQAIRDLLTASLPITVGTPAFRYLTRRCGCLEEEVLADLRYHPGLHHSMEYPGVFPALLAIQRSPAGECATVMRIYLTRDGRKADVDPIRKMMPCVLTEGSAVRLGRIQDCIGIAEGLETAICARTLSGVPVWAAMTANLLSGWEPPAAAKSVIVFGDNDESFTGQAAAFGLAKRLKARGLDVEVRLPPVAGSDWADEWAQTKKEEVM